MAFLPVSKKDMEDRGWDEVDFVFVSGDGYVDHPSFGLAIISRLFESRGYRVGIIAQPAWKDSKEIQKLGRPRLGFLVSSGVIDSMVNHYTANKSPRSEDLYSPGGIKGKRPNRALIVYCNLIRQAYGDIPIIIGGVEASLRRFAHYDYWDDKVRQSVLADTNADLLVYGMGEGPIIDIMNMLDKNIPVNKMRNIKGTCYMAPKEALPLEISEMVSQGKTSVLFESSHRHYNNGINIVPAFEQVSNDKKAYAKAFKAIYDDQDPIRGGALVQEQKKGFVVQNPLSSPLDMKTMDEVYDLEYERRWHPMYDDAGGIPAFDEVAFSITSHRGCFGGCSFCSLSFHQGRIIQKRSKESIFKEAEKLVKSKGFKGYIHDIGGPSANFREKACKKQIKAGTCKNRQCMFPEPCSNLEVNYKEYLSILRHVRKMDGVKKVFIRSGIRYDHLMLEKGGALFKEICAYHISGQLKVAPEHIDDHVLSLMGKPKAHVYERFSQRFYEINKKIGKEQYLVPYLISSHPGSGLQSAVNLALFLKKNAIHPEQVQNFYPTPGTLSTAMYYSGYDPRTMGKVYVPRSNRERAMQRALLQWAVPKNANMVREALESAGRKDLIGFGKNCLIRPEKPIKMEKPSGRNKRIQKNKKHK